MPSRLSRSKPSSMGGGSKRKANNISSSHTTPVRQSGRIKKPIGTLSKRPPKKKRTDSNNEDFSNEETDSKSVSDFDGDNSKGEDTGETSDDADDGPQSYSIPLPKVRDAGDTPYEDSQIHPNTFLFLRDLKANNNRDWLKWNDKDFRISLKDFESFIQKLSEQVMERDPTIPELPKKDIIFRIYRDIRFSPDPTPYKPFFSAAWSRTGKKGPYAAYYVQLQPGASFIGGGLWHPDGPALATIREDIDLHPERMKGTLMNEALRQTFFEKAKKDEKKVVAAFVAQNQEGALKTKPKGFDADHKDIDLLRLRNFTLGKKIADTDVLSKHGIDKIADIIDAIVPWVTYLNSVVMPDPSDDDDDSEDDDEEGDSDSQ